MKVPAARAAIVKISRGYTQDKSTSAYGEGLLLYMPLAQDGYSRTNASFGH